MRDLLLIAAGGAFGAVGRYLGSGLAYRLFGEDFPYGTLFVNVAGCLVIGFFMQISLSTDLVSREWRILFSIGFLGAFTTFSTFGYESLRYMLDGAWLMVVSNVTANVIFCLAATWLGWSAARTLLS